MSQGEIETLAHKGVSLAVLRQRGAEPTFVWLGGFRSDMAGAKAEALAGWAAQRGQAFVRFDYSGHGRSGGRFEDGSISRWLSDAAAVLESVSGPLVLVGSSMGGWIALLAARAFSARTAGLLLIAPAADFTERLMWPSLSPQERERIKAEGRIEQPSAYSPDPNVLTWTLIEDGRKHLVMDGPIGFAGPVRILQGAEDPDVPAAHVASLARLIQSPDLEMDVIAGGDHRLSRPQDIARLTAAANALADLLAR